MGNCVSNKKKKALPALPQGPFDCTKDVLHVISVVFNPAGFNTRVELYKKFAEELGKKPNVVLYTVECLFPGQTEYTVTKRGHPRHLQLRGEQKIWLKENLINLAVQRLLPPDWEHMAWVDGDLLFHDNDIAARTIRALGVHPVVQMWEQVNFLGPRGEVLEQNRSFGWCYRNQRAIDQRDFDKCYPHPGFAWAMTRRGYNYIQGLPEFSIVGNGDNHFAYALIGRVKESIPDAAWSYVSSGYEDALNQLQTSLHNMQKALRPFSVDPTASLGPGYALGATISHMWHGDWKDRGYVTRWNCLVVNGVAFDPMRDLRRERNGTLIVGDPRYLPGIERYFTSRNEDSMMVVTDHANKHRTAAKLAPAPGRRHHGGRNGNHRHGRTRGNRRGSGYDSDEWEDYHRYHCHSGHNDEHHDHCESDHYGHGHDHGHHGNNCHGGGHYEHNSGGYDHSGGHGSGGGGGGYDYGGGGGYDYGGGGGVFSAGNSAYC